MSHFQKILLSYSDSLSEDFLSQRRIKDFIRKKSDWLQHQIVKGKLDENQDRQRAMLWQIYQMLPILGIKIEVSNLSGWGKYKFGTEKEVQIWRDSLVDGRVVHKGILVPFSAGMLLTMLISTDGTEPFFRDNATSLLRHVEVKRNKALMAYEGSLSSQQFWEERCTYSVLFSKIALIENDWRFANTALKLNEWLWQEYHHPFTQRAILPFLWALVQQEVTLQELVKCCE